jgi:hypothetical protein
VICMYLYNLKTTFVICWKIYSEMKTQLQTSTTFSSKFFFLFSVPPPDSEDHGRLDALLHLNWFIRRESWSRKREILTLPWRSFLQSS